MIAVFVVLCVTQALAEDANAPATQPAAASKPAEPPDMLVGAIDPYIAGAERTAFFQVAGVDNELDEKEFTAGRKRGGFIRRWDRWKAMLLFDKNRNGALDWFEVKAYRQDIRERVLAAFDANKDSALTGAERTTANEALAAGRVPGKTPDKPAERVVIPDNEIPDHRAEDRRPGGEPTSRPDRGGRGMPEAMVKWRLKHFDLDGDGELGAEEMEAAEKFRQKLDGVGRDFRRRMADLDGDGEVSDEERQKVRAEWMAAGLKMLGRSVQYMDTDGDGQISREERTAFRDRMRDGTTRFIKNFSNSFDADASGRLDAEERDKLIAGMSKEFERRSKAFDANEDGRISPDEMIALMEDFLQKDLGIRPTKLGPEEPGR